MFAMVAANHHALIELFNQASQLASVRLLWQNPNCLVASYNQHGPVHNARLHQFSFSHANAIVASSRAPDSNALSTQINEEAAALSRRIKGAHTAFCWVADKQHLVASRDALNQHCLYYARVGQVTVISSEASFIAGLLPAKPALNPAALACWLAGEPNPELCLYTNIEVLPLGCSLRASPDGGIHTQPYWDIDPTHRLELASDNAYRDAFYQLLNNTVGDHIPADENVVVSQMSGGMDSTSITALAHKLLSPNRHCRPLSHLYSQSESCDESDNIKAMYAHLGLRDPIQITVDAGAHRDFLSLYPTDFDSPGTVLSPRYHQECEMIKDAGSHRLLTGNGGDEMCWGHASAYTQRLTHGELGVVSEVFKACKQTGMAPWPVFRSLFVKPMIPPSLMALARQIKGRQPADLPAWLTGKASKLAQEAGTVANPFNKKKDKVGYARYQALKTTSTFNSLRSYQKVAWQYGIEVVHPFFDPRIAEFTFAIPPKQLIRGAYPKWLLRNAMDSLLPESVCWNVQKVTFDNHFGKLVKDNAEPLRKLLQDTRLEDMGLLDNSKLLDAFDSTVNGRKAHVHVDLLYAILTQRWIQQHH